VGYGDFRRIFQKNEKIFRQGNCAAGAIPAKKKKSGLSNGTFVDPFGVPYRIAFAEGTNRQVIAGTNNILVQKRVAVWSQPDPNGTPRKQKRRYVTSSE
jgi:hypothetical protein